MKFDLGTAEDRHARDHCRRGKQGAIQCNDALGVELARQKGALFKISLRSLFPRIEFKLYISPVLRRSLIIVTCFVLVAFMGWLDYISGFENSLLIFYLAPIAIGTWFLGVWFGIGIEVLWVIAT